MHITKQNFSEILRSIQNNGEAPSNGRYKLTELFHTSQNEKLHIHNIKMYLYTFSLNHIDFSNCVFDNCDFSYIDIYDCEFNNADFVATPIPIEISCDDPNRLPESWRGNVSNTIENLGKKVFNKIKQDNAVEFLSYQAVNIIGKNFYYLDKLLPQIIRDKVFYYINQQTNVEDCLGWKLHLSVDSEQIEQAFDLAAPILFKNNIDFKVINIQALKDIVNYEHDKSAERVYYGSQITIYLESNNKIMLNPKLTLDLINEIDKLFQANNIKCGIRPESDASTISEYFSLRNDKFYFTDSNKVDYLPACLAGKNYNLSGMENPYQDLLIEKNNHKEIDDIVKDFNVDSNEKIVESLQLIISFLLAKYINLNRHVTAPSFFNEVDKPFARLIDKIMQNPAYILKDKYLLPTYRNNDVIKLRVKILIQLNTWLSEQLNNLYADQLPLLDITKLYNTVDDFSRAFDYIDSKIKALNDNTMYANKPSFSDYIADNTIKEKPTRNNYLDYADFQLFSEAFYNNKEEPDQSALTKTPM